MNARGFYTVTIHFKKSNLRIITVIITQHKWVIKHGSGFAGNVLVYICIYVAYYSDHLKLAGGQ